MKVPFQGKEVEAHEVEVITKDEYFNIYKLSDGNLLMVEAVLTSIQKLEGVNNPDGTPVYIFHTQNVSRVKPMEK